MKVRLVSTDHQLHELCRQTLAAFPGREWDFAASAPNSPWPEGDLLIWDFNPDMSLPHELDFKEEQKNIFLVQRKQLGAFRDRLPLAAVATLLKPVNRAALRTFLEHAMARYEAHKSGAGAVSRELSRSDRDEMLQCLLHANLKLQEYDQDRTNFLARAVHDFRTPLSALNGYSGLLLGQQLGPLTGQQAEVLQRMQHSIKRLSRMATAMFQLSVGNHVQNAPDLQPADIEACIDQALHEVAPAAQEKHLDISVLVTCPSRTLYFEAAQIEQVLMNLLDNACKFTPKHGSIEIRGYPFFWERRSLRINGWGAGQPDRRADTLREPNAFRVEVRDSGPGIPAERLDKIFEEYTSYAGGRDRSGGGLGLAICRMAVNAHQGHVWAESNGEGAAFSFVIPFLRAEQAIRARAAEAS